MKTQVSTEGTFSDKIGYEIRSLHYVNTSWFNICIYEADFSALVTIQSKERKSRKKQWMVSTDYLKDGKP